MFDVYDKWGPVDPLTKRVATLLAAIGLCMLTTAAVAQDLRGKWYGLIENYGGERRRVLGVTQTDKALTCTWDEVGTSVDYPAKCTLHDGVLDLVTGANNKVHLRPSAVGLTGTFTLTGNRGTYQISMDRTPHAVPPKSQTTLCRQKVSYSLTPSSEVPAEFRKYLGVWSGDQRGTQAGYNVDYELCVAFVIERITADGTVHTIRVGGDSFRLSGSTGNSFSVKPDVSAWRGKVAGESLRLARGKYLQELHLSGSDTMEGAYSDPNGTAVARLRRQ